MFTYLDPTVRKRLVAEGKLVRIDRDGRRLEPDETTGGQAISILGAIPLPLRFRYRWKQPGGGRWRTGYGPVTIATSRWRS